MGLIKKQKKKVENNIIVSDFVSDVETYEVGFSDDDSDMLYGQREHFVKCNLLSKGLDKKIADKAIQILNTPINKLYDL